ncbi:hypothetical protein H4582DRAFT_1905782 [Lactarius indigo]|nr:hypothetical protein H4582DRAFT_1905782 [Lactarius indigo]
MAQPSSSHRERDREGHSHRSERSTHHRHHRTISSTTLLLVLSLILAVLAVMLSLPSQSSSSGTATPGDPATSGVWSVLTPKRSQALIARESNVAVREAEVARREAEILAGAPGGVVGPGPLGPAPTSCPPCVAQATFEPPPIQTVIKEVVQEKDLTPPGWWKESNVRFEDILDRELKIAEREREISRREETVNRREHDASRREAWIMEQLAALGGESAVEEEYVYEPAGPPKRRPSKEVPPVVITEIETATRTVTQVHIETQFVPNETVVIPPPANTRRVAHPTPSPYTTSFSTMLPRTTSVEVVIEHEEEVVREEPVEVEEEVIEEPRRRVVRKAPPPPPAFPPAAYRQAPQRWW